MNLSIYNTRASPASPSVSRDARISLDAFGLMDISDNEMLNEGAEEDVGMDEYGVITVEDDDDGYCRNPRKHLCGPSRRPIKYDFQKTLISNHRQKLTHLLRTFADDHNWKKCAAILTVLIQSTPTKARKYSLAEFRKNFLAAIEVANLFKGSKRKSTDFEEICKVWLEKIVWTDDCSNERRSIKLELAFLYLMQGNYAHAKSLIEKNEGKNDPKAHLLHGLTSYQIWYSQLPVDMQLKDFNAQALLDGPTLTMCNNNVFLLKDAIEYSDHSQETYPLPTGNQGSRKYESDSSVDNNKQILDSKCLQGAVEVIQADVHNQIESFQRTETRSDLSESFSFDEKLLDISIFNQSGDGLDASLLPIVLQQPGMDIEQRIHSHKQLLTDNYVDAVKHLRMALYSDPPLLSALFPLVQILLLGDQVGLALRDLKKFCHLSNTTKPFRILARLLEIFCGNEFSEISNCFESILKKDPTCSYSLERLIKMFKDGNYSSMDLLEMIALHLDSTSGNHNIWDGFASCLLNARACQQSRQQQDRSSGNQTVQDPLNSNYVIFLNHTGKDSWHLRIRWWSKCHFNKNKFQLEIQAGSWQLMTAKAACASHLYGPDSAYVRDVLGSLRKNEDVNSLSFLEKHVTNSLCMFKPLSSKPPLPISRNTRHGVDPAWAYGEPVAGNRQKSKCNFCGTIFAGGGITRLKQHLSGGYGEVKMCQQCPEDVRNQARILLREKVQKETKRKPEEASSRILTQ